MTRRVALVAAAAILAAATGIAQEPGGQRRKAPPVPPEQVFKTVDTYFVKILKERLGLTDEQLERVLPAVKKLQGDRRELARRRFRAMSEMRRVLTTGGGTEAEIAGLLREVKAVEAEEAATLRRDRDAVDASLTPIQQAKFRVLEVEVERRIRHALSRGGRGRPGQRRPHEGDGPPPEQ